MPNYKAKTNPAQFNIGRPKSPMSSTNGSTCGAHKSYPRPADVTVNDLHTRFVKGEEILQADIDRLRQKIRIELDARIAHAKYSSASGIRNSINSSAATTGQIAAAATSGALLNSGLQALGGPGSPANTANGAVPVAEGAGTKSTTFPATNQLNIDLVPYTNTNNYPSNAVASKANKHSPPYTREIDRKGIAPVNVTITKGSLMRGSDYKTLLDNYQRLVMDCICHSDCNCNAVCACHNNCGCNY